MAVDANKYFRGLRSYLNTNAYEITKRDHSVRHYHYDDLNGMKSEELDNQSPVLVG